MIAIGDVRHAIDKTAEARASYVAARKRLEAIVRAHPDDTRIQSNLATSHDMIGILLREIGDPAASLESFAKAMSIRQKLVDANPGIASYTVRPGYDDMNPLTPERTFYRACRGACRSGLACLPGSGISIEAGSAQADLAMMWLHRSVDAGRRSADAIRNEAGLDAL